MLAYFIITAEASPQTEKRGGELAKASPEEIGSAIGVPADQLVCFDYCEAEALDPRVILAQLLAERIKEARKPAVDPKTLN